MTPAPSRNPSSIQPGLRLQHYELIRELSGRGMGQSYLARDTRLGRRVTLKLLPTRDDGLTQHVLAEARAIARCAHENIATVHDVGQYEDGPFLVLEHLQGQSLREHTHEQRLSSVRAVELMVPVIRALACAHAQGLVHHALTPENIVVTDSGTIKVLDFGMTRMFQAGEPWEGASGEALAGGLLDDDGKDLTCRGTLPSTLEYLSPEQWGQDGPVDHLTDIWAVGIILFELLAGQHPLGPLRGPELAVTARLDLRLPPLRTLAPGLPRELAAAVDRCLLKSRDQRCPDAPTLLRALEPFLPKRFNPEPRLDTTPYVGLAPFQEADADRFFGRTREIATLVHRLHYQPMVTVAGPASSGKTSLVLAGLLPTLKRSGTPWETFVLRPGADPLAALAQVVEPLVGSSQSIEQDLQEQFQRVERLRLEPGYVGRVLRDSARRQPRKILLVVDQLEELYTRVPDARERAAFTACLAGLADDATSPIRVVLCVRSNFLDRVPEDERFMAELAQGIFFLGAPTRDGLHDALVRPAELAGYRFETPSLVDDMLAHLETTQGALPLMQFAATWLWESRDTRDKLLTRDALEAMGGITHALASHADRVLAGLSARERALTRTLSMRLVTPERTRALVMMQELCELTDDPAEPRRLIEHLVRARLLVLHSGGDESDTAVELVHESLIHDWPTLRHWLDEGLEDTTFLKHLSQAARQWQESGRARRLLWRGEWVEEARRFQRRAHGAMSALQRDFLEAVFTHEQRRLRRARALLVGGMTLLGLVLLALALVLLREARTEAEYQAAAARAAEEMAQGAETLARDAQAQAHAAEKRALRDLAELQARELKRSKEQVAQEEAHRRLALAHEALRLTHEEWVAAVRRERAALTTIERLRGSRGSARVREARREAIRAGRKLDALLQREQTRSAPLVQRGKGR
ncbi:protein kinase domain-containing protein [Cystobacter ferrugineus]|uniref:AAA family ATPase n=1 Tax=Cystobacter ferrugineus TaxID=83449 RepID=A0A1L9BGE9_9BACT|nr:protein kinase [Cystobacter ferrugineus]OJH41364.1 AAA family ATPase [Cystobacter ferrugineus]